MKKKYLFFALPLIALLGACNKEHQCKCELVEGYEDGTTQNVFYLDGSLDCEDITEMSFEEHTNSGNPPLEHTKIRKVKCRVYGD